MNLLEKLILRKIKHYNHEKYWKMREYILNPSKKNIIRKYIYLLKVKKSDSFNCCSFGTNINNGATFDTAPILPHGPNGIIVNGKSIIGKNCTIFHQVTIGEKNGFSPTIGDNVVIYPGAKIIGKVFLGDNCIVGPNSVVINNVESGEIVSGVPAKKIGEQSIQNNLYKNNY